MTEETRITDEDLNNPAYWINGVKGTFNLSAWSRDNEPKPAHNFKVGDKVSLTVEVEVTIEGLLFDVDGTPLYKLSRFCEGGGGYPEESFTLIEEAKP